MFQLHKLKWYSGGMGLYVNQRNNRTELQEKLAAELREKAKKRAELEDNGRVDGVDDSKYVENTKQTTSLAWAWVLIGIATIGIILFLVIRSTNGYTW